MVTGNPEILRFRHGIQHDASNYLSSSRIVMDATAPTSHTWFILEGPPRLVFDLRPMRADPPNGRLPIGDGLVDAVRWGTHPGARVRVVLDLARPAVHRAFWLKGPPRLVIDVDRLEVTLYNHETGRLEVLPLDSYLIGVLGAEVPASFQTEALKAQTVAARTYALRRLRTFGGRGCRAHPGADVCSDPSHCQGYSSPEKLRERWKEDFDHYLARLAGAVGATRRRYLVHGRGPADAVYHSTCGGHTASSAEVWGSAAPYLPGVPCEYCEISPRYRETRRVSLAEIKQRLGVGLLSVKGTTASGRATEIEVGAKVLTGADLQPELGLPSTLIEEVSGDVVVTTRGSGHGVGLCQWGAEGQARLGRTFREILHYYYPGTTLGGIAFGPEGQEAEDGSGAGPDPEPGPSPGPLPVVVIDPGHGGADPGATGPGGLAEKSVNLAISLAAAGSLAGRAEVLMTRRDDRTVSLRERIDLANNRGATLFLSVHCNGATQPEANGTETFHYAGAALGRTLATLVQRRLLAAIRRRDRGVKQANFFVLRETSCPAALAEILFITNPQEAALLTDPAFQRRVGEALGAGVIDYLEQVR